MNFELLTYGIMVIVIIAITLQAIYKATIKKLNMGNKESLTLYVIVSNEEGSIRMETYPYILVAESEEQAWKMCSEYKWFDRKELKIEKSISLSDLNTGIIYHEE